MGNLIFGLDIGGTGIKGGIVDVKKGRMETERIKMRTPRPSTPDAVADTCLQLIRNAGWTGSVGVGFPSIIKKNVCFTATNIDSKWIGKNVSKVLSKRLGLPTHVINDADAAALCEAQFGAAYKKKGLGLVITIGTGIGGGMLFNGKLIPNLEPGSTFLENGINLEKYSSNAARRAEMLTWPEYGKRLNKALEHIDRMLSPDYFILGGGISKNFDLYEDKMNPAFKITPAQFQNEAGTIGAALAFKIYS